MIAFGFGYLRRWAVLVFAGGEVWTRGEMGVVWVGLAGVWEFGIGTEGIACVLYVVFCETYSSGCRD